MAQNPPPGVDAAYVGGFFARNRATLEGMLRAQMAPMLGGAG